MAVATTHISSLLIGGTYECVSIVLMDGKIQRTPLQKNEEESTHTAAETLNHAFYNREIIVTYICHHNPF